MNSINKSLIVLFLMANLTSANSGPLHDAVTKRDLHAVINILNTSAEKVDSRDHENRTPLMLAAYNVDGLEIVKTLIKAGADVNAKDKHKSTSLHNAAFMGSLDIVKYLISSGAIIEVFDKFLLTPRGWAKLSYHYMVEDYLADQEKSLSRKAKASANPDLESTMRKKRRQSFSSGQ